MLVIFLPFNTTRHPGHLVRRVRDGDKHDKTPRKGAGISLLVCVSRAASKLKGTGREVPLCCVDKNGKDEEGYPLLVTIAFYL